jgi:hypothetical protein
MPHEGIMFQAACAKALKFTFPVIISQRTAGGKCMGGIAAFVVLNNEGWIATCFHTADLIMQSLKSEETAKQIAAQKAAVEADASLSNNQKRKKIDALPKLNKAAVERVAVVWAINSGGVLVTVKQFHCAPPVDLAVGKLEPFDPAWVAEYPKLKDPTKNFEPGVSLCRSGYPFHSITPTCDATNDGFVLQQSAFPIPTFVIDGMLTRLVNVVVPGIPGPPPFPMKLFETSSPGLRGQSGGPVFDKDGTIWGVQSDTVSYPLGFNPPVPNSSKNEKEYQFLNVGRCIHTESIIGLLKDRGVKYDLSAY